MKKKVLLLSLFLLVVLICCGCQNPIVAKRRPCSQPNTKWISADKTIEFVVDANGHATGTMILDGETIAFYMENDMGAGMDLFTMDVLEYGITSTTDKWEHWLCSYRSMKKFVATVKKTTFFQENEKIVFYRVD